MIIQSTRLTIRTFNELDVNEKYISWLNDPVITRFSSQRFHYHTHESCKSFLKKFDGSHNDFFLIELTDDNQAIGTATVYRDINNGLADIGLLIGERRLWGNGYGAEAFNSILQYLLNDTKMRKVTAGTMATNLSMKSILERSGMTLESIRYKHEIYENAPVDILQYCVFNSHHYLNQ